MFSKLLCFFGLVAAVNAQVVSQWSDPITGVIFWRYYRQEVDSSWGYVFPPLSGGQAPNEFIGIFQGPVNAGWIGNSLGGAMRSNPLLLGWTDGSSPKISSRWATDYAPPSLYTGPRLTILGSSGTNSQIQRIVYRCQNCTSWTGGTGGISPNGTQVFGWAFNSQKPLSPADPASGVYRHSGAGQYALDVGAARTSSYDSYLQELTNAPPLGVRPTTTVVPTTTVPTTTVLPPTTAPTTVPTTAPPITTRPPTTTLPPSTTVPPPSTTVSPPSATQTLFGQCAGVGYSGPTRCPANSTCKAFNEWYSACTPN